MDVSTRYKESFISVAIPLLPYLKAMSLSLQFDAFDNPMYLKKVGNWVITFLNSAEQEASQPIRLAIRSVLPIQISDDIQPRAIHIQQTHNENVWHIENAEFFSSTDQQHHTVELQHALMLNIVEKIMCEFKRYDVNIQLLS